MTPGRSKFHPQKDTMDEWIFPVKVTRHDVVDLLAAKDDENDVVDLAVGPSRYFRKGRKASCLKEDFIPKLHQIPTLKDKEDSDLYSDPELINCLFEHAPPYDLCAQISPRDLGYSGALHFA